MAQIILDSNNNLIQGDFDNATINNRTKFKTTTTNATTNVYAVPNGSATSAGFTATNAADPTNASKITIATNGSTDTQIISGVNGSGTYLPLSFYTNNALAMQVDTSANLSVTGRLSFSALSAAANIDGIFLQSGVGTTVNTATGNNMTFNTGTTERMRIDSSGNLLVNLTSQQSSGKFCVNFDGATHNGHVLNDTGSATSIAYSYFLRSGTLKGYIGYTTGSNLVSYNTTSDYRLKENIVPLPNALDTVMKLKPSQYSWKENGYTTTGFIAHELAEVVPDCVTGEKDAVDADGNPVYQGIDTSFLVATLTAAIQEQQAIINELKTRIEALENK